MRSRTTTGAALRLALATAMLSTTIATTSPPAHATTEATHFTYEEAWITSEDGTQLYAQLFHPADAVSPRPAITTVSPYAFVGGTRWGDRYRDLMLDRGWTYVDVSLRGWSRSGGCADLGGPGEQMDARASVDWVRDQAWSDGRVGALGWSYDGGTALATLTSDTPPTAAAILSPVSSWYDLSFDRGVRRLASIPQHAYYHAFQPMGTTSEYPVLSDHPDGNVPHCVAEGVAGTAVNDPSDPYWVARDLPAMIGATDVPLFMSHGYQDAAVPPSTTAQVADLAAGPLAGRLFHGGHAGFIADHDIDPYLDFFEAQFADAATSAARTAADGWTLRDDQGRARWRAEWPDAVEVELALPDGSYTHDMGATAAAPDGAAWVMTDAMERDVRLTGIPTLAFDHLEDDPTTPAELADRAVALLYVVEGEKATLVSSGASLLGWQPDGSRTGATVFDLAPVDVVVPEGSRIALAIAGHADAYVFPPTLDGAVVQYTDATLTLPFDRARGCIVEEKPAIDRVNATVDQSLVSIVDLDLPARLGRGARCADDAIAWAPVHAGFGFEDSMDGWTSNIDGVPPTSWTRVEPGHESAASLGIERYPEAAGDPWLGGSLGSRGIEAVSAPIDVGAGRHRLRLWSLTDLEQGTDDGVRLWWRPIGTESWKVLGELQDNSQGWVAPTFTFDVGEVEAIELSVTLEGDLGCAGATAEAFEPVGLTCGTGVWLDDIVVERAT